MVSSSPKIYAGCISSTPTSNTAAIPANWAKAMALSRCSVDGMDPSEPGGKGARLAHGVHHTGSGIGASETDTDGAVDESEYHEPPAGAPEGTPQNMIGIGIRAAKAAISPVPQPIALAYEVKI